MVERVAHVTGDWSFDAVSIGIPAVVHAGHVVSEPVNLGPGWVGFDFQGALGRPTKVVNDAAIQALGSYEGGKMLFLGLGSTLVVGGIVVPMELGHLPFRKATFEDYVGEHGRKRLGKRKWQKAAGEAIERLAAALEPDCIVLGGGNAKRAQQPASERAAGSQRQRLRRRVPPLRSVDPRFAARVRTGRGTRILPLRALA
jgi:polyphosphate glucokinase